MLIVHFQCIECEFEASGESGQILARIPANHIEHTGHFGEVHVDNFDGSCAQPNTHLGKVRQAHKNRVQCTGREEVK